jgi:ring-1,2-phenylacetyl-CoA epoxidase subunit PaaC
MESPVNDPLDAQLIEPLTDHLLAIADDKLMLGHCQSEWTGLGPILEEDIAFSSIAQDELAHASAIYQFVADLADGDADAIAFDRQTQAYRCADLVTMPDGFDWAVALLRQYFCDQHDAFRIDDLTDSSHPILAALSKRLRAEEQIHLDHTSQWITRLARGTDESHQRMQTAVEMLQEEASMLLEPTYGEDQLAAAGVISAQHRDRFQRWHDAVTSRLGDAGLSIDLTASSQAGGRTGHHAPHFATEHEEMCQVRRLSPGATW